MPNHNLGLIWLPMYLFVAALLTAPMLGQNTVWEIGKFDNSSLEFTAPAALYVTYQTAVNDWIKAWPAEQKVGSTYEIDFNLDSTPQGTYTLRISTLTYSPRIPALKVQINGHDGTFYLDPKLSYYLGDQRSIFDPHYSSDDLSIDVPAGFLKTGANTLTLSVVNTEAPFEAPTPESELYDAVAPVHYDALRLSNDPGSAEAEKAVAARVLPSIFYRMKAGHLQEEVEATMRFGQPSAAGQAELTIEGQKYTAPIAASEGFGEQRVRFDVPEWTGTAKGTLEVAGNNGTVFDLSLTAARKWTVYVVPHTHVDVGYTDYQGKVAEAQARTLDEAAELIKKYPDFRFSTDGSWNVEQFLARRSSADQRAILDLMRQGKIGVPAQYANLLTGYASLETLYRSLYYSKELSLKFNLPYTYANTTDVPTYTGAYPSILASSGIKYWVVGGNNDRAPILSHERWNERSPFWWEGPDGKRVLFCYSRCYEQVMFLFGLPPIQAAVRESLPIFMQAYERPEYKPDAVLIYGTQPENTDLFPDTASFATTWNQSYAYPKLVYATLGGFFRYIGDNFSKDLPTYKGDMGGYWEDGIGSDAAYAAQDRHNQNLALAAEVVSTVAHTTDPVLNPPKAELADAWKNMMLFSEHTWTAGASVTQPDSEESVGQLAVKDDRATQTTLELTDVSNTALSQLANEIHIPAQTLVVFNSLSWKRDAVVETDLMPGEELVDMTTHVAAPIQTVSQLEGFRRVRFVAGDLPPVGYKCYQIRQGVNAAALEATLSKEPAVENQYYRVTIDADSGAIRSIYDKELQRELVDAGSPYKFGQYLYVTGGDGETRMINPFKALPLGDLTIHPSSGGTYAGKEMTPWGELIRLHSSDVNTPSIDTEISLYDDKKKIEIRYNIHKDYITAKEAVYIAFPIAVQEPRFAYGMQQGWIDPAHDMFKGASLEWFNVQGWMAALDSKLAVGVIPVDTSLASFGDVNRGLWAGEFWPKTSTIFSYAMNNYWHTNYRAGQGGNFTFRYVLTSADHLDGAKLERLSAESMEAPLVDHVVDQDKVGDPMRPLPAEGTSFLDVKAANVALVTWKMAEDGRGTILRLREIAGQPTDTFVEFPHSNVQSAALCNGVEDVLEKLDTSAKGVHLKFRPYEVLTVRLLP